MFETQMIGDNFIVTDSDAWQAFQTARHLSVRFGRVAQVTNLTNGRTVYLDNGRVSGYVRKDGTEDWSKLR